MMSCFYIIMMHISYSGFFGGSGHRRATHHPLPERSRLAAAGSKPFDWVARQSSEAVDEVYRLDPTVLWKDMLNLMRNGAPHGCLQVTIAFFDRSRSFRLRRLNCRKFIVIYLLICIVHPPRTVVRVHDSALAEDAVSSTTLVVIEVWWSQLRSSWHQQHWLYESLLMTCSSAHYMLAVRWLSLL